MNIAEKLIKLRKEKGITQENLSKKLNISISAIRNYENTKNPREPKNDILIKFANFYNVSTEYLLNDEINNKTEENITIENKLNLSDKTIEKIVEINTKVNNEVVGKFIDYMPIRNFWEKINTYINKNKQIRTLLPLKKLTENLIMFDKYTTNDTFDKYYETNADTDDELYIFNFKKFCKNNGCKYKKTDKDLMLKYITALKTNELIEYKYGYIDNQYDISIDIIENLINSNALIPIHIVKILLSIPQTEIDQRIYDKELMEFQLSHELTSFLKFLDNEEQEAE